MRHEMNPKLARWMADVADALTEAGDCDPGYGVFHISEVVISFDGEETNYRIQSTDDGTFWLGIDL